MRLSAHVFSNKRGNISCMKRLTLFSEATRSAKGKLYKNTSKVGGKNLSCPKWALGQMITCRCPGFWGCCCPRTCQISPGNPETITTSKQFEHRSLWTRPKSLVVHPTSKPHDIHEHAKVNKEKVSWGIFPRLGSPLSLLGIGVAV